MQFAIASTMVSQLDSFPAIMGLARGRSRFIENKKMGVNISVGNVFQGGHTSA